MRHRRRKDRAKYVLPYFGTFLKYLVPNFAGFPNSHKYLKHEMRKKPRKQKNVCIRMKFVTFHPHLQWQPISKIDRDGIFIGASRCSKFRYITYHRVITM